jgi:hypothetical protein
MSRVLRRPMFRGGIADSEGVGITSGLNNPRQGYADGPTDEGVQPSIFQSIYDSINPSSDTILNRLQSNQEQQSSIVPDNSILQSIYDAINPSTETIVKRLQKRQQEQREPLIKTQSYREEQKKLTEAKTAAEKLKLPLAPPPASPPQSSEEVSKKQDFKTIYEDLLPIFRASVGPDQDEYTRQKYLELAKFGLNLLKPTPAGIKPSLLGSVATAAEKPLEGYGNIIERERQAAKVPEALALQQAMRLSEPGTVGKAIRDLIQTGAAKNEKEALNIYLKGDSASQRKQASEEKQLIRSDLQGYKGLKGIKDQAIINQLADLVYQDPSLAYKIKGERSEYKPEAYEEGAIYIDKGKIVKYKKGLFYTPSEPGFKG